MKTLKTLFAASLLLVLTPVLLTVGAIPLAILAIVIGGPSPLAGGYCLAVFLTVLGFASARESITQEGM